MQNENVDYMVVGFLCLHYQHIFTSSAAQGGGGNFKNRNPIGEVGCCESEAFDGSKGD
jgi:hypothetical protein